MQVQRVTMSKTLNVLCVSSRAWSSGNTLELKPKKFHPHRWLRQLQIGIRIRLKGQDPEWRGKPEVAESCSQALRGVTEWKLQSLASVKTLIALRETGIR